MIRTTTGPSGGFTLTELMIVVAIVGILAAIGYPQYQSYVREARRTDAHTALLMTANAEEKYYAANNTYTSSFEDLFPGESRIQGGGATLESEEGYYSLSIPTANATTFTITATAVAGTSQANDSGCTAISINAANQKTPATCWGD